MLYRMGTMKHVCALIGAVLLAGAALLARKTFAQYDDGRRGGETIEGVISDTMCGASHGGKDSAKCTMACVNSGKGWAFVVGGKVYVMEGRMAGVSGVAGQKAKVTGRISGNKINVTAIEAAD
jgi:hypothetical protein